MWQIQWLRRLIRRNTKPIPLERAKNWKLRLSVIYAVCAWNALGLVIYMCMTGKQDWMKAGGYAPDEDIPPARSWAHILGIPKAQVIRMSGFSVLGTYEINEEDELNTIENSTVEKEDVVSELE